MKGYFFNLDGHTPVECEPEEWRPRIGTDEWCVKRTEQGDVAVSTVFLGLNHRMWGTGPPILFETMLFVAGEGRDTVRYANWDDAEAGHDAMVRRVFRMEVGVGLIVEPDADDEGNH